MAPPPEAFFRSDSADSAAPMVERGPLPSEKQGRQGGGRGCWLAVAALALVALQVASASGLFVYFTLALGKLKAEAQGTSEELRCLVLLNRLQDLSNWEELVGNRSCLKMASSIRDYVTGVTEDVIQKSAPQAGTMEKLSSNRPLTSQPSGGRPSAHLTLRRLSPIQPEALAKFGELPQSCRHPIAHWADQTMHAHLQNVSYRGGQLSIRHPGKYYVYAQVYFRYPTEGSGAQAALGRQLVQCVHLQGGSGQNALLLKGVGTKCWAKDATYGLHALYQGGLFDLRAGDRLFVSVSTLDINDGDEAGSYFGAFRLDG